MNRAVPNLFEEDFSASNRVFTRKQIDSLLNAVKGKTLGEADIMGVLTEAVNSRPDKVVRGIAGDVIEVSVLGCGRDSRPEPDILVDGVRTELKTTGLQKPRKRSAKEYEPKEPLTITNISPETLKHETFDNSRFYHKIEHLLFVFYHYALTETAKNSGDYSIFPILGHLFWEAVDNDLEALRNDWHLVQDFVRQHKFDEDDARRKLKENLMLIDYSSPKQPRFRFKKTFVSTIVDRFLQQRKYEVLPEQITRFSEIDDKCHLFTAKYKGKTLSELCSILGIQIKDGDKDACQRIIIKMFGGQAKSINQIEDFNKIGLIAKTLILTSDGKKTEDTKLFRVDFDEWCNPNTVFDEQEYSQDSLFYNGYSQEYSYFAEHSFIFTLFEEPHAGKNIPLSDCKFLGFKRYSFNDNFINTEVRSTWEIVRDLVINKKLTETKGARGYAPNFPKGKQHTIFLRGSGSTSKDRKERLKDWGIDIKMYIQWAWIKGDYIVEELSKVPFL